MSETADKNTFAGALAQEFSHFVTLSNYIIPNLFCQPFFPSKYKNISYQYKCFPSKYKIVFPQIVTHICRKAISKHTLEQLVNQKIQFPSESGHAQEQ